jgi:putative DNA primase/helicase
MRKSAIAPAQGGNRCNTRLDYTTSADAVRQFADAVYRDTGANIQPIGDGEVHRFNDIDGKRNNLACWYVLHLNGCPAGAYGSWRTGYQFTWRADKNMPVNKEERERMNAAVKASRAKRKNDTAQAQAHTAGRAQALWRDALPATVSQPYLKSKRIPSLSLRQAGNVLLVPLHDIGGELVNLQTISPAGEKRFLKGGRIAGCFALTGAPKIPEAGELYVAEGFATAATIASTLDLPVVAAMNAGNLKSVAVAIRRKYPRLDMVVAADNDHKTPGNPGIVKGKEAASAVQGALSWPSVCMSHDCTCTDFNDTAHCRRATR